MAVICWRAEEWGDIFGEWGNELDRKLKIKQDKTEERDLDLERWRDKVNDKISKWQDEWGEYTWENEGKFKSIKYFYVFNSSI